MKLRDVALAVLVAVVWGVQFVIVGHALVHFPPLLFAAIRFAFVAFPAMLFVPRPDLPWSRIIGVGLTLSAAQFGLQYLALAHGMPPGLLSLVLQSQVGFTLVIAVLLLHEHPSRRQVAGLLVAGAGVLIIAIGYGRGAPILPLLLVLLAGLSWGAGNVLTRSCGNQAGFSLTVWSSLAAPLPLFALSLLTEGPRRDWESVTHPAASVVSALLYTVIIASLLGYGIWSRLLARHESHRVAPFSLLVPPIGMLTAWLVQSEMPTTGELAGGTLMILGALLCLIPASRRGVRSAGVGNPESEPISDGRR